MFGKNSNVLVQGGTFSINQHSTRGIDLLKVATAPAAFHNSRERFNPPKCHPRTREAVLKKIMEWVQRKIDTEAFVMWLYGAAGAGKSAIAQTIAEICYKERLLLATFFFSRSESQRNNTERLVASIAYQMILAVPSTRGLVEAAVEDDPLVFTRSLEAQFMTLIVRPLEHLRLTGSFAQISPPNLIILDGLDECMDGTRTSLIDIIPAIASECRHLVFLIASRAEQDISTSIRFGAIEQGLTQISLDDGYQTDDDIERYYLDKFDEIKRTHPLRSQIPPTWPMVDIIATLVRKASWQFIYASTVISYVGSIRHRPTTRLDVILGVQPPRNENDTPFAQLDALYRHIIASAEDPDLTLRLISTCQLFASSNLWLIEDFLHLPRGDSVLYLNDITAIIQYSNVNGTPRFRMLHASLGDFLFEKSRSHRFYVDAWSIHTEIAQWCVDTILTGKVPSEIQDSRYDMWHFFSKHFHQAQITPRLMGDILSVSFQEKFTAFLSNYPVLYVLEYPLLYALEFIESIKLMRFEGAKSLYTRFRSLYDEGTISFFDKNSVNSLDIICIGNFHLISFFFDNPHMDDPVWNAVRHISDFTFRSRPDFTEYLAMLDFIYEYRLYIDDFLGDKTRSGWYAIGQSHYTSSAENCVKYLLNPRYLPIQGVKSWAIESKKRPWFWRKKHLPVTPSIHAHYKYPLWKKYRLFLRVKRKNWHNKPMLEPALEIDILLTILTTLLAMAALDSTSLVTLCREVITRRLIFYAFPTRSKAAKRAIQGYLSREKAQERKG